jgi:hypothetical protein
MHDGQKYRAKSSGEPNMHVTTAAVAAAVVLLLVLLI